MVVSPPLELISILAVLADRDAVVVSLFLEVLPISILAVLADRDPASFS